MFTESPPGWRYGCLVYPDKTLAYAAAHGAEHNVRMAISLLQELANKQLPLTIEGAACVDAVQILSLAGHVVAEVSAPVRTPLGWLSQRAVVTEITHSGRRMARVCAPGPLVGPDHTASRTCGPLALGIAAVCVFAAGMGAEFLRGVLL